MSLSNAQANIIAFKPVSDANVTLDPAATKLAYTAITGARVVTMGLLQTFDPGEQVLVWDASGSASGSNTITLTAAAGNTINGASTYVISTAYGVAALMASSSTAWTAFAGVSVTAAAITSGTIDGTVIGGVTPAAGTFTKLTSTTYVDESVGNALTAAGTTRTDALQLAKQINNVTTAAASTGVILPSVANAGIGAIIVVFNAGASPVQVYGSGSDTIDTVAGATGVPLANAKRCIYIAVAAATYISAQLGVVSA